MKSIGIAVLLAASTLFANPANASGGNIEKSELNKALNKAMSYPEFAAADNLEGTVYVSFRMLECGADITSINASDERFAQHVSQRLELIGEQLSERGISSNATFTYKFTFQQEMQ